jgi:hypothetical protein
MEPEKGEIERRRVLFTMNTKEFLNKYPILKKIVPLMLMYGKSRSIVSLCSMCVASDFLLPTNTGSFVSRETASIQSSYLEYIRIQPAMQPYTYHQSMGLFQPKQRYTSKM